MALFEVGTLLPHTKVSKKHENASGNRPLKSVPSQVSVEIGD